MTHELAIGVAGGKENTDHTDALASAVASVPRSVVIALILRDRRGEDNRLSILVLLPSMCSPYDKG